MSMFYPKRLKKDFIYTVYDRYTPNLQTIEDYEAEIRRARQFYKEFNDKYWNKKEHRWAYGMPRDVFYFMQYLLARIDNCYIKINQLKMRGGK